MTLNYGEEVSELFDRLGKQVSTAGFEDGLAELVHHVPGERDDGHGGKGRLRLEPAHGVEARLIVDFALGAQWHAHVHENEVRLSFLRKAHSIRGIARHDELMPTPWEQPGANFDHVVVVVG